MCVEAICSCCCVFIFVVAATTTVVDKMQRAGRQRMNRSRSRRDKQATQYSYVHIIIDNDGRRKE
jgi:hypothetical protein